MATFRRLVFPLIKSSSQANQLNNKALTRCLSSLSDSRKINSKHAASWKLELRRTGEDGTHYAITLNNVTIKTPMKNPLVVPQESLGLAILAEWKTRENMKKKIDHRTMHLTTLAYEAIDNPFKESNESAANDILEYLKFDCIRFRDTQSEELLALQARHWDPLIGWFEHQYQCQLPIEYGQLAVQTKLPSQTLDTISKLLMSHPRWPLVGAKFMAQNLKSFVLTSCLMTKFLQADQVVDISRLETRFQTDKWSKVESEHDMDEQSICARVAAGSIFYHLTNDANRQTTSA